MGKFLWEGRKKGLPCWLSQFSKTKLRQPTGQNFFPTFLKKFSHFLQKVEVTIATFVWKMQKKSGIMKSGLDAMPFFLLDDLLMKNMFKISYVERFVVGFGQFHGTFTIIQRIFP